MSSTEINTVAIMVPTRGKIDVLHTLFKEYIDTIRTTEPEVLEFKYFQTVDGDEVKFLIFERYASQAALDAHMQTEHFQAGMKKMQDEGLLAEAPVSASGVLGYGFRR